MKGVQIATAVVAATSLQGAAWACDGFPTELVSAGELVDAACAEANADTPQLFAALCGLHNDLDATGLPTSLVDVWNDLGGNGSLTFGARVLDPGQPETGNLIQGTHRTFVVREIMDNRFQIDIDHRDGRADLEVYVCAVGADDQAEVIAIYGDGDQTGFGATTPLSEASLVMLQMRARSTGPGVQRYRYQISVTPDNAVPPEPERPYGKVDLDTIGTKGSTRPGQRPSGLN